VGITSRHNSVPSSSTSYFSIFPHTTWQTITRILSSLSTRSKMLQAHLKSPSGPQKIQKARSPKDSIAVNCTILDQSSKLTEGDLSNEPEAQSPQEQQATIILDSDSNSGFRICKAGQTERLLEPPSNNDWPYCQSGIGDDDPFFGDVEEVVQNFNSSISSSTFADALRSHQISGWILLWEVSREALREELFVKDLAQQDKIWNSILELCQKSKGYHDWTAEWEFDTSL
jgi:hypothetical protein